MTAGRSAEVEARQQLALAEQYEAAAIEARATAGRYGVAAVTEKRIAQVLTPLAQIGTTLLADRRWPGVATRKWTLSPWAPRRLYR